MRQLELKFNFGSSRAITIMTHLDAPLQVRSGVAVILDIDDALTDEQLKAWYESRYSALGVKVFIVSEDTQLSDVAELVAVEVTPEESIDSSAVDTVSEQVEAVVDEQSEESNKEQVEEQSNEIVEDLDKESVEDIVVEPSEIVIEPSDEMSIDVSDEKVPQIENADSVIENIDSVSEEPSRGKIDLLGGAKKSVKEMSFNEMKTFAKEQGIKVVGRTKKAYEKAIKAWEKKNHD